MDAWPQDCVAAQVWKQFRNYDKHTFLFFQLVTNICEISSRYGEKDLALTVGFSHVFFPNEALGWVCWVDRRVTRMHTARADLRAWLQDYYHYYYQWEEEGNLILLALNENEKQQGKYQYTQSKLHNEHITKIP